MYSGRPMNPNSFAFMPVAVAVREAGVGAVVADARFVHHAVAEDPGPAHADALVAVVLLALVADPSPGPSRICSRKTSCCSRL